MLNLIKVAPFVLLLAACAPTKELVKPEVRIAKQIEYVIKIPPEALLTIPAQVEPIDVDRAKQSDIAKWIIAHEERSKSLENLIIGIAKFFKTEQTNLELKAAEENANAIKKQSLGIVEQSKAVGK